MTNEPTLNQRFSIGQYTAVAESNDIDQAVLIQVLNCLDETYEFLATAADHRIVAGVVGWVDLEAPDVADVVAELREAPGGESLVGVRHLVQGEPDPDYLGRPTVLRGLRAVAEAGLVFDLLVRATQLPSAVRAVQRVENLSVVLDHAAKPTIAEGPREPWTSLIADLAATGRVQCKLSGLVSEAGPGWTDAEIRPFVEHLLHVFGAGHLLFGSDWPVCTVVASYAEVLGLVTSCLAELSTDEQAAILRSNALSTYGLPERGMLDE